MGKQHEGVYDSRSPELDILENFPSPKEAEERWQEINKPVIATFLRSILETMKDHWYPGGDIEYGFNEYCSPGVLDIVRDILIKKGWDIVEERDGFWRIRAKEKTYVNPQR